MARQLSERESAALRSIEKHTGDHGLGATGDSLAHDMTGEGLEVTKPGAHQTAASLVRKRLAVRAGTSVLQWYRITHDGRQALKGDASGAWVARAEATP